MMQPREDCRKSSISVNLWRTVAAIACATLLIVMTTEAQGQTFQVIHNFTGGSDGGDPMTGLTVDQAGNLYGTTWSGGSGFGTVFKLERAGSGWLVRSLYSFQGGSDGAGPSARVIIGPDGNLYGTTSAGGGGNCGYYGYDGCGTVFRLQPPASVCKAFVCPWTETVLYRANEDNGAILVGEVVFDQAGNLYTTARNGGMYFSGYAVELTPNNGYWVRTIVHVFDYETGDGEAPSAGMVIDQAGNLYGTTSLGGLHTQGTAFELTPYGSGWTETILHSFDGDDGYEPEAPLIFDRQGNLYGTTFDGGPNGEGVVFELSPGGGGWSFSIPWSFSGHGNGGSVLVAPVSVDANGNLWGTTFETGCCGWGTIFELTPGSNGWSETVLHNFTGGLDGSTPFSNVAFDAQGNAYGTASLGGANRQGVIWEITP